MENKKHVLQAFTKALQSFIIIMVLMFAACTPDDNTQPTPTDARDKIIGTYSCEETENGTSVTTFDITVRKSTTVDNGIIIDNFFNIGNQYATAGILLNNTLTIKQQTISNFIFVGDGNFNGSNKITLTYKATAGGTTSNCTATATKQ